MTTHQLVCGDSRDQTFISNETVHLALTSPPYWNLKEYERHEKQLGVIVEYGAFLNELEKVWKEVFRVLVPGGRLIVVVGDVMLSRKKHGRHQVIPLHADITLAAKKIGFDNLSPIIWHKIGNVNCESKRSGSSFLGKPYQPNGIIKNNIEYILMFRKPGGYRSPTVEQQEKSQIDKTDFSRWFRQIWTDIPGARSKLHPATFPEELASRLIQMFSFVGDTVLDPFNGLATTMMAAMHHGRNSIGIEIEPLYLERAEERLLQQQGCQLGAKKDPESSLRVFIFNRPIPLPDQKPVKRKRKDDKQKDGKEGEKDQKISQE